MIPIPLIIFFVLVLTIIIVLGTIRPSEVIARWHHYFDKLQFSTQDCYKAIEDAIEMRKIPSQSLRKDFFEGGLMSAKREYLRVTNVTYIFDICAAPYGTGFFVSWWLRETKSVNEMILDKFLARGKKKTYYQLDTQNMFRESVHKALLEAVSAISNTQGVRGPSELESQAISNPKFNFASR